MRFVYMALYKKSTNATVEPLPKKRKVRESAKTVKFQDPVVEDNAAPIVHPENQRKFRLLSQMFPGRVFVC